MRINNELIVCTRAAMQKTDLTEFACIIHPYFAQV